MENNQVSKEQMRRVLAMAKCVVKGDGMGFKVLEPDTAEGWEALAMSAVTTLAVVASAAYGPGTTRADAEHLLGEWLLLVRSAE